MIARIAIIYMVCFLSAWGSRSYAQIHWPSPEVEQMYEQARGLMMKGSFPQAIAAYQQLVLLAPEVMEVYRDLGRLYYLTGAYEDANKTLTSVINSPAADRQSFQIAAASLAAQQDYKKARAVLQQGIDRFPNDGLFYHELGKQHYDRNEREPALKAWLDGIAADPVYHVNYYEAARMYMGTKEVLWAILYGEIFLTRESQTPRAAEMCRLMLDAYKRFYYTPRDIKAPEYGKTGQTQPASFYDAVHETFRKLAPVVSDGLSVEDLVMLRTRFIIDWGRTYADQYPFSLFNWHERLLQNGHFDAYNQWLFGKTEHTQQYEAWVSFHKDAIPAFEAWMVQYPYRPAAGEFYNEGKLKGLFSGRR